MPQANYNITSVNESTYNATLDLITRGMWKGLPNKITDQYPLALSKENMQRMKILSIANNPISHCCWYPYKLQTSIGEIKTAAIGSVITDSKHRKKGYSQKVLKSCIEDIEAEGFELAILWSNLEHFFGLSGFHPAGCEYLSVIETKLVPEYKGQFVIKPYSPKYFEDVFRIYNEHPQRVLRTKEEFKAYLSISNTNTFVLKVKDNIEAYAVIGKGSDFPNYIHEWGGYPECVIELILFIAASTDIPEIVVNTPSPESFIGSALSKIFPGCVGTLGMINILDPVKFSQRVFKNSEKPIQLSASENNAYKLTINNKTEELSKAELTRLFFGPHENIKLTKLAHEINQETQNPLPILAYIWGLDSI